MFDRIFYVDRTGADVLVHRLVDMRVKRHLGRRIAQGDRPLHRRGDGLIIERVTVFVGHADASAQNRPVIALRHSAKPEPVESLTIAGRPGARLDRAAAAPTA